MGLLDSLHQRLLIVTGKGGVGKTTLAASLALGFAKRGQRVLVAEIAGSETTEPALQRAIGGAPPDGTPRRDADGVHRAVIFPSDGHRDFLVDTLRIPIVVDTALKSQSLRRFLTAAPGFSEMGALYRIYRLVRPARGHSAYDRVIIDAPATGHSVGLAQIPEMLVRVMPRGPVGRAAADGLAMLRDPKETGLVLVTAPERLPVTEALELAETIDKHRLHLAGIVVNRLPSLEANDHERTALEQHFSRDARAPGALEFELVRRADEAMGLLKQRTTLVPSTLPEIRHRGPAVAAALAVRMEANVPSRWFPLEVAQAEDSSNGVSSA